jgi:hypothetical protein
MAAEWDWKLGCFHHDCWWLCLLLSLTKAARSATSRCDAGHELQLAEDAFKLQHLLECNILQHREEVEEITNSAVKEEQIEIKLAAIESDWAALNLVGSQDSLHTPRERPLASVHAA